MMIRHCLFSVNSDLVVLCILSFGVIFTTFSNAALVSGGQQSNGSQYNETSSLSFIDSNEHDNLSASNENSVFSTPQGIKLKEIRKLARLAGHEHPETITDFDAELCYNDDCLEAAREFYSSMDFSKEPCTEWKKFACEWRTLSSKSALNQLSELTLKVENQVLGILQDPYLETEALISAHEYFRACIAWFQDFNKIEHAISHLQTLGNWPLLTGSEFGGEWVAILTEIIKTAPDNVSPFLIKFSAVAVNENKIVLLIDVGATYMEIDADDILEFMKNLQTKFPQTADQERRQDIQEMQKSMQILSMGKYYDSASSVKNPSLITLKDLDEKLAKTAPNSKLNIMKLVQNVFSGSNVKITGETEVLINADSMIKFLTSIESVSEKALVNILFLQLAFILLGDTTNTIEDSNFLYLENYKRSISGNPSHHCIKETSEVFNFALSEEFIRRHYSVKSSEMINNITENLKTGFSSVVDSIKWLQAPSRDFLREKIKNVEFLVGFPKWILDTKQLNSYYSNLKLTGNTTDKGVYLKYRKSVLSWLNGKSWTMKLKDESMDGWNSKQKNGFVGDTNVEYISNLNQIRIPAGVLQLPLFSNDFPGFMNFGGIGSIIAREMVRIIDSKGIYLNSEGDPGMWLDEKSLKNYMDWSTRLQGEWEDNKSELTLNDKIIHVTAYHITVKGYKEYLKETKRNGKQELKLPGLAQLQPEVLLQIKYTNVLCEDPLITKSNNDCDHSHCAISRFEIVPVTQTKHFMDLFDCDVDRLNIAFDLD